MAGKAFNQPRHFSFKFEDGTSTLFQDMENRSGIIQESSSHRDVRRQNPDGAYSVGSEWMSKRTKNHRDVGVVYDREFDEHSSRSLF